VIRASVFVLVCAASCLLAQGSAREKYRTVKLQKVDNYPQVPVHIYLLSDGKQCVLRTRLYVKEGSDVKTASEGDHVYIMDSDGLVYKCGLQAIADHVGPVPPTRGVIGEVPFRWRNEPNARMNPADDGLSPRVSWAQEAAGPTVRVVFSVDDTMELPAFKATCNRPCNNVISEANGNYEAVPLSFDNEPNSVGLTLRSPRPLGAGVRVLWVIRSLDERAITIADFRILEIGEVPAELRH
jgi:hypothetical protein